MGHQQLKDCFHSGGEKEREGEGEGEGESELKDAGAN